MASNTKTKPCIECLEAFSYEPIILHGEEVFARPRCEKCAAVALERNKAASEKQSGHDRLEKWHAVCPPIYRDTDVSRISVECGRAAMTWDFTQARGLGFLGATGIGKTRSLFLALKRAFDGGKFVRAVSHNAFSRTVQMAFSGDGKDRDAARTLLDAYQSCGVLLLDDVGKPPPTERADAELEELVEQRTSNMRPILWSANGNGAWLIKRMGTDRGEPLVRRLSEFCEIVNV